ncbi:MAG: aspartate aminotransferase family protein [Pyrinomonadaceae bacterium]
MNQVDMKQAEKQSDKLAPPLGDMDAAEFRRYGHEIIDWISDYLENMERYPVLAPVRPNEFREKIPAAAPAHGESMEAILADVNDLVAPALTHWNHPSFFAYFSISASAPGIFGELLAAAFNVNQMLWRTAPAATELEEVSLAWLRQMLGLPDEFQGIIYDTASISTMHAIAAARENLDLQIRERGMSGREALPLLRVYASEQAHSSIEKALIALGLGQNSLCKIPTDEVFRMDAHALARAIEEDKRRGALPFCVVATVGTTSTTSIDPVNDIADVCEAHKLWLHVDAAYGGSAAVVPEMRFVLDGCERADSIVTNPHKWLFAPIDCSALYCRRMDILRRAFSLVPEYLRTTDAPEEVRNGMDYGVQLGRRFRALKLWMVMRYFGQEGLAARIREHWRLARLFASWVEASNDWELSAPVPFGLVCFRARPQIAPDDTAEQRDAHLNALNEAVMHNVNATGEVFLSHTKLHDSLVLRLAVGNIRTTEKHVRRAWQLLNEQLAHLASVKP